MSGTGAGLLVGDHWPLPAEQGRIETFADGEVGVCGAVDTVTGMLREYRTGAGIDDQPQRRFGQVAPLAGARSTDQQLRPRNVRSVTGPVGRAWWCPSQWVTGG